MLRWSRSRLLDHRRLGRPGEGDPSPLSRPDKTSGPRNRRHGFLSARRRARWSRDRHRLSRVPTSVPLAIVCGVVSHGALRPKSYAIRSAEVTEEIVRATGDHRSLVRATNPVIAGADPSALARSHGLELYDRHARVRGDSSGTTSFASQDQPRLAAQETFGCGAYSTSSGGSGYYVAGTFATTISEQNAGILRVGKAGAESLVAYEKQP